MVRNLSNILAQSDLFRNIDQDCINQLLNGSNYNIKEYTKNDVFALAGERVSHLMIVLEGVLIARMVSDSGKFVQIDKIETGRIIAPAMLFAENNTFPVNVIPESKTLVLFIHRDVFLSIMHKDKMLLFNFIQIISNINNFLSSKINSLSLKSIRGKLAEYILNLSKIQKTDNVVLNLSKQELADKFAISRQALSRSLSELEDEEMIGVKGKIISLLDKKKLKEEG